MLNAYDMSFFIRGIFIISCLVTTQAVALDFEIPAGELVEQPVFVLQASKVLTEEKRLQADVFQVRERVLSDGFLNHYWVTSPYGDFEARGTALLEEQTHELRELRNLAEKSTAGVVLRATGQEGLNVITAPARTVGSLVSAMIDPEGTWKTFRQVPSGVVGLFQYVGDQASKTFDSAEKAVTGEKKVRNAEQIKIKGRALDESERYALRWSGYSAAEKEWYANLGVDPYTENDNLRAEIRRVSRAESAINIAFKFVPGVGGLAFVGDANKVLKYSRQVAAFSDPRELKNKHRSALKNAKFDDAEVNAFLNSKLLTPTLQTAFVEALLPLAKIQGASGLLTLLSNAQSKEVAILLLENISYLTILNRVKPIKELLARSGVPVAIFADDTAVLVIPADTVFYSPTFAASWARLLNEAEQRKIKSIDVRLRGPASPALRAALDRPDVFLFENVPM